MKRPGEIGIPPFRDVAAVSERRILSWLDCERRSEIAAIAAGAGKIRLAGRGRLPRAWRVEFDFKFTADGLIPAIVQEAVPGAAEAGAAPTGRVLMFAWLNRESLAKTLKTGLMHYWSRSRGKLWLKGETSGHTQRVVRWWQDCDQDVLLFEVEQAGGACHTGYRSCFFQELDREGRERPIREEKTFDDGAIYRA